MTTRICRNKGRKHNVKTFLRLLAIITVICVMMLAGCKKKEEEPVATQPAVTEASTEVTAEVSTEVTAEASTEEETQETVLTLEEYIESVHSEYLKNEDNKNSGWSIFIWNYTTGTAELKSNNDKVQLKEDEKLVLYIPGGIDSTLGGKGLVESTIGFSNHVVFTLKEFSGEQPFDIAIKPKNEQLESFDLKLTILGDMGSVVATEPSVDKEFSEKMPYEEWYNLEDVLAYISESNNDGIILLWEGNVEEGRGMIITNGEKIHKGENQKIIYSTMSGLYSYTILTPETASKKPFKGTDFEMAVIDSNEEFDVKFLVENRMNGTETEFTFTVVP